MKKPQQPKPKPATPKAASKPKRFVLSPDVMSDLGQLSVALPTSDEEVKGAIEALKEKLTYYKENQARVTQEVCTFFLCYLCGGCVLMSRTLRKRRKKMKRLNENNLLHFLIKRTLIYPVEKIHRINALKNHRHLIVKNDSQKRKKSMEIILQKLLEHRKKLLVPMKLNLQRRMEIALGKRRLKLLQLL